MGSIKERLRISGRYIHNQNEMANQLEHAGDAIESEFEKLYVMLAQRTKRIEALEEQIKHTEHKFDLILKEHLRPLEIREDVPTDKDGKPPGGLEPGDVLEYHSPCYQKRIDAIFIGQTSRQRHSGWIEAYRVCDGKVAIIDIELDECKFKFRPRFPER